MLISGNWDDFVSELNKEFLDDVIDPVNYAVEQAFLKGWESAVNGTRVRTGKARGSWDIAETEEQLLYLETVPDIWLDYYDYPEPPIMNFNILAGDTLTLGNTAEWIDYLEYGSATTNADLMFASAITTLKRSLNLRLTNLRKRRK